MTEYSTNVYLVKTWKTNSLGAHSKEMCCANLMTTIYDTYLKVMMLGTVRYWMNEVRTEFVEIAHPRNGNIRRGRNFVGTIHGIQLTRKTHKKPVT